MDYQDFLSTLTTDDLSKMHQQIENFLDKVFVETKVDESRERSGINGLRDNEAIHLSPREKDVAQLVARGLPNKCIAKHLNISHWTVATHLRRIFRKLGVSSRTAMIAKLVAADLLPKDDLLRPGIS